MELMDLSRVRYAIFNTNDNQDVRIVDQWVIWLRNLVLIKKMAKRQKYIILKQFQ